MNVRTIRTWSDIKRVKCEPTESSNQFFCEVHHTTKEGSTLDSFYTSRLFFEENTRGVLAAMEGVVTGTIDNVLTIIFEDKDGYCELQKQEYEEYDIEDEVVAKCGKEPTMGKWLGLAKR